MNSALKGVLKELNSQLERKIKEANIWYEAWQREEKNIIDLKLTIQELEEMNKDKQ